MCTAGATQMVWRYGVIGEASICTKGLAKLPNGVEVWGVSGARIAKKLGRNEMVRRCGI